MFQKALELCTCALVADGRLVYIRKGKAVGRFKLFEQGVAQQACIVGYKG